MKIPYSSFKEWERLPIPTGQRKGQFFYNHFKLHRVVDRDAKDKVRHVFYCEDYKFRKAIEPFLDYNQ